MNNYTRDWFFFSVLGLGLGSLMTQQYYSYIVAVSFIGGGRKKPEYNIMLYPAHLTKISLLIDTEKHSEGMTDCCLTPT